MPPAEEKIIGFLRRKAARLRRELERACGRDIALAEHINRLEAAVDALEGTLACRHCGAQLTGRP